MRIAAAVNLKEHRNVRHTEQTFRSTGVSLLATHLACSASAHSDDRIPHFDRREMPITELDRLIWELLEDANKMQSSDDVSARDAFPLIDQLVLCARRADAVHYRHSARLLRAAALALGRRCVPLDVLRNSGESR